MASKRDRHPERRAKRSTPRKPPAADDRTVGERAADAERAAAADKPKRKPRKPRAVDPRADALRIVQKREALSAKADAAQAQADALRGQADALSNGLSEDVALFVSALTKD